MAPDTYIHGHHDSVLRSHRWRTAENSAAYLLDHLEEGMDLLDVGCGPATLTAELARRVDGGRVVGVDAAPEVLAEARAVTAGVSNVEIVEGSAYHLDFDDASFDVVHAHQVLQHLADPVAALTEMARVCRPGGIVAARDADYGAMTWWPLEKGLERWLEIYRMAARASGAEPDAGRRLGSWAREADIGVPTASASVWCFTVPADRRWWADLWAERVVDSELARQVEKAGISRRELTEVSAAWRRWAAAADGWFVVLHGEVICRRN